MEIFEVIIQKKGNVERVFYSTRSAQAVRRHYKSLGYEVVLLKRVTAQYIKEIEELELEIKSNIITSDAVSSLLNTWFGGTLGPYLDS